MHSKTNNMEKVIIITGASSGFGKAVAERLAQKGHKVYGICRREMNHAAIEYKQGDIRDNDRINPDPDGGELHGLCQHVPGSASLHAQTTQRKNHQFKLYRRRNGAALPRVLLCLQIRHRGLL